MAGTAPAKPRREKIAPITTRPGLECLVAEITNLQLQLAAAVARMEERQAEAERKLAEQLRGEQQAAEAIGQKIKRRIAIVQAYVEENRDELFPEAKKSLELPTATIGFRFSSKAKVVLTGAEDDWESAALRLEALSWGAGYIRTPEPEVDKDKLIAARESLTPKQLAAAGVKFEQPEKFYVEPKSLVAETSTAEVKV